MSCLPGLSFLSCLPYLSCWCSSVCLRLTCDMLNQSFELVGLFVESASSPHHSSMQPFKGPYIQPCVAFEHALHRLLKATYSPIQPFRGPYSPTQHFKGSAAKTRTMTRQLVGLSIYPAVLPSRRIAVSGERSSPILLSKFSSLISHCRVSVSALARLPTRLISDQLPAFM